MNRKVLLNDNWTFAKTASDVAAENKEMWEPLLMPVDLPHDWLIYDTENLYEDSCGWYRRELSYDKCGREERIFLRFEGVYMDSTLYVNGQSVGDWKYGYSTFEWDITDFLNEGKNEILMQVRYQAPNSRWYSGAGIYRDVWLVRVSSAYIPSDGVYISTREIGRDFELLADTELEWTGFIDKESEYNVVYTLYDEKETVVSQKNSVKPGQTKDSADILVHSPKRWDITEPKLYELEVKFTRELNTPTQTPVYRESYDDMSEEKLCEEVLHIERIKVGFRSIDFTPEEGFFLNGRKVKWHGACDHHDFGSLGAVFSKPAMRRKFELMRSMGVNAIRTSHNMPAPGLVELADEMGILVVCESFDCWEIAKTTYDYARFFNTHLEKDVRSWIRRDRNHPSVIMWSIGNEISDTHVSEHGQDIVRRFINDIRKWDYRSNARITIGSNYMPWENAQKCADILKIAGYNYAEKYYEQHHEKYPDWVIYGSETASLLQSRGVYHFPLERATLIEEDEQCSSLGNTTPSWAAKSAEYNITMDRDTEYSCGQFIWTAIDYIGEPTPYQTKNSYFGQMDTAGFPKDAFYLYQAEWTDYKKNPMVHVYPYWDFNEGQQIDIRVCSNAPEIELFVNGVSMGRQKIDHKRGKVLQPSWKVTYVPGSIEAVAYDEKGNELARECRHSFKDAVKLVLEPEKQVMKADGEDLIYVKISAVDEDGYPVENAADYVRVRVEGAARLVGLDNGDSADFDQYKGTVRKLFSGKLMAVLAAKTIPGDITVTVEDTRKTPVFEKAVINLKAVEAPIRRGVSAHTENKERVLTHVEEGFVPVRKLELSAENLTLSKETDSTTVRVKIYPEDATDRELIWKVVDEGGMESRIAVISEDNKNHAVTVKGLGDGTFIIRCMTKNGTDKVKLISQLDMKIEGMGEAFVSPFEPVTGAAYSSSIGDVGRGPEDSASTDKDMETVLTYTNIDFGEYGSDEITLSIYANDSDEHNIQIWQGVPGEDGSSLLGDVVYCKPGIWETFQPDTYKLDTRVKGITSISIVGHDKWFIRDFSFTKQEKAFGRLDVAEYGVIYGDSYEKLDTCIEHIGNNVSIGYDGMNFGESGTGRITICGRTPLETNTIQIRFVGEQESVQVVSFPHSDEYTELTFDIDKVTGENQVTFVFLPGCNFDFKWFRFERD
jgi:beta-galactosidase